MISNLGIDDFHLSENTFTNGDDRYQTRDLIELSKQYKPFDLPIAGIDIGIKPWGDCDIKHFAYHMQRIEKADLAYPIILDDTGYICDGWHRLVKAILAGHETIKAIRLPIMPDVMK